MDRMPNQLSGGQQQRIALARALVIEPDAVLLDEPLSNLDARLRLEMRREIRRIHGETGITMVYVTHDQKEALSMADHVAVMSLGRVEQVDRPRALYRLPANRFVAEFVGEPNFIPGTLVSAEGELGRLQTPLGEFSALLPPDRPAVGGEVLCLVRPESLRAAACEENRFRAVVKSASYLGEVEQLVLEAAGLELRLMIPNPRQEALPPGTLIDVSFAPEYAVILK